MFSIQLDHFEFLTFYFELRCIFRRLYLNKILQRVDKAMIENIPETYLSVQGKKTKQEKP